MRVTHLSLSGGAEGHYHHPVSRLQMENDDLLLRVPKKLDRAGIQQGKEARARLMQRDSGIESEATALLSYSPPRDVMRDSSGRTNVWVLCLEGQRHRPRA